MIRNVGIVKMSYGLLEQAMHLPEGHHIRGLRLTDRFTDTFEICVEGPSLPAMSDDQVIPIVSYMITVSEGEYQVPVRAYIGKFEETRQ